MWGVSEHIHCDNTATNANNKNASSRMEAHSARKRRYGDKGEWVKYWACLGYWISPCYGPFSLGGSFETYEPFISFIFNFFFRAAVILRYWISGYGGTTIYRLSWHFCMFDKRQWHTGYLYFVLELLAVTWEQNFNLCPLNGSVFILYLWRYKKVCFVTISLHSVVDAQCFKMVFNTAVNN
jgi:hypothetical protein